MIYVLGKSSYMEKTILVGFGGVQILEAKYVRISGKRITDKRKSLIQYSNPRLLRVLNTHKNRDVSDLNSRREDNLGENPHDLISIKTVRMGSLSQGIL